MTLLALRPQPLGVFPPPAGWLVLPASGAAAALRDQLLQGRAPESVADELRFYTLALAGDLDGALAALDGDPTPEARYNRFVLRSTPAAYAALRGDLDGELGMLLRLVAHNLGYLSSPPEPGDARGELAAVVGSAWAARAAQAGRERDAIAALRGAANEARGSSPLLAARQLGELAELQARLGDAALAGESLAEALTLAVGRGLLELQAQLALRLGIVHQELAQGRYGRLLEAARCYQDALRIYTREAAPELFALAQNNLALVYLALPLIETSAEPRLALAVQGLRAALTVYTRSTHPEQWASAQLNLADALRQLASDQPEIQLAEVVELYEALLLARDEGRDSLSYARLLASQGSVLAQLGRFGHARYTLSRAAAIFARSGDIPATKAVEEVLATIARHEQDHE